MRLELREQARNRWAGILPRFGIPAKSLDGKQHPCPVCGGKDRFRFDNKEGAGTFYCNACLAGDGVRLVELKTGMDFAAAAKAIREVIPSIPTRTPPRDMDATRRNGMLNSMWASGRPIGADEAGAYLRSRGIIGPYPAALRFVPRIRATGHPEREYLAGMLAMVSGPDGKPVNLHRTFLENGRKAQMKSPRAMCPGKTPMGSAIRLFEHSGTLGIAEGIETALHAHKRFGIPVWSVANSTLLKGFIIPDDVHALHIFGDNDRKYGGQAAAYSLAHRAETQPCPVKAIVHIPDATGMDWADIGVAA